ncbi:purine nucleosidase [Cohaesibacter marisflavi]|uniref:Purine nucleosidase n=1 Tax=Cohaesibacter marisflavi TaxID=655353 RepID=A0A1I5JU73_9HYPH|nr:nucleoside hydrolase [Cohaesibacter marisflavi]SFO76328.1 purine nucleosidase [Cohaesibacter marisflavi]
MGKRIFLSSDPGIDDMAAILFALADRDIDLIGIGAVAGNVSMQTALENARFTCALAVPSCKVACYEGSSGPLLREQIYGAHKALGLFRDHLVDLESSLPAVEAGVDNAENSAALAMAQAIRDAAAMGNPITFVVTGPMTDLALAMKLAGKRACLEGIENIVAMGGAFEALGNRAPYAEMNMLSDPHAARMVCESGIALTLFPLDATWTCRLTHRDLDQIAREAGLVGQVFARLFRASDRENPELYGGPGGPVHDLLPVVWLVAPELFLTRRSRISVATGPELAGHTSRVRKKICSDTSSNEGCTLPHCIAEEVNSDGIRALFLDHLKSLAQTGRRTKSNKHQSLTNREEDLQ